MQTDRQIDRQMEKDRGWQREGMGQYQRLRKWVHECPPWQGSFVHFWHHPRYMLVSSVHIMCQLLRVRDVIRYHWRPKPGCQAWIIGLKLQKLLKKKYKFAAGCTWRQKYNHDNALLRGCKWNSSETWHGWLHSRAGREFQTFFFKGKTCQTSKFTGFMISWYPSLHDHKWSKAKMDASKGVPFQDPIRDGKDAVRHTSCGFCRGDEYRSASRSVWSAWRK